MKKILSIVLIEIFFSIGLDAEPITYNELNKLEKNSLLYSRLDEVRVRKNPKLSKKAIGHLFEGERVSCLGKMSKNKEKLILRGKKFNLPFILIKRSNGTTGWVYAGAFALCRTKKCKIEYYKQFINKLSRVPAIKKKNRAFAKKLKVYDFHYNIQIKRLGKELYKVKTGKDACSGKDLYYIIYENGAIKDRDLHYEYYFYNDFNIIKYGLKSGLTKKQVKARLGIPIKENSVVMIYGDKDLIASEYDNKNQYNENFILYFQGGKLFAIYIFVNLVC